jgi:2-desacetyl-2-hydroxyethyl bacteriochlorophyllide A dehydrogenase
MDNMKAARVVGLGQVVCEQVSVTPPRDGDVLVRSELAAICGSDLHAIFAGVPPIPLTYPYAPGFPGHEGLGTVVESRSPLHKPGDRVLCCPIAIHAATFAEYQTLPGDQCIPLPPYGGPAEHLLMAQQMGTIIFALRQHPVDVVGKTVVVMGQGSAGNFFAYLLKRNGAAKVIVSDLSEARLGAAKVFGADVAVKAEPATVRQAVLDHTGGQGADFLVEAVGARAALLQTVDLVRPGATMLYFGLPDSAQPVPWNFHDFFRKRLTVYTTYGAQVETDRVSFRLALDLIAKKQIDVTRMISHRVPLDQIDRALRLANDRSDNALKVTVTI